MPAAVSCLASLFSVAANVLSRCDFPFTLPFLGHFSCLAYITQCVNKPPFKLRECDGACGGVCDSPWPSRPFFRARAASFSACASPSLGHPAVSSWVSRSSKSDHSCSRCTWSRQSSWFPRSTPTARSRLRLRQHVCVMLLPLTLPGRWRGFRDHLRSA